jgi:hypothetical protein
VHIFALTTTFIRSRCEQQQNMNIRIQLPTPTEHLLLTEFLHTNSSQELLYSDIDRLSRAFKGHRCSLDFDRGFVHSELRNAMIEDG